MSDLLLGIDIGTSSSKAVVAETDGRVVARAVQPHRTSFPRPGWAEHDAEAVWWNDVRTLCSNLPRRARDRIAAVAVSGIGPCVVPCDGRDRPLRPAILYGIDTRASAEVDELTATLGAEEIVARGGSALSSQALGPKLLWLARNEPEVAAATRRWHSASSFVVARLTGAWSLDHHSASQCNPLYDLDGCEWNGDWAEIVAPGLPLPPLAWPTDVIGEVARDASAETGIPPGTPVAAGTIDAWAEAVSAGVRAEDDLMIMYGSTMFFVLVGVTGGVPSSVWITNGVDPGTRTLAAGMATSGLLAEWTSELTSTPLEELIAEAAAVRPGADGLLLLPYFAGERSPFHDPEARGVLAGLRLEHKPRHVLRAALEATAFGARHNLETLADGRRVRVVAVGGGARASLWPQIVSDVTGLEQEIPAETIGASYGDALLAGEAIDLLQPGSSWATTSSRIVPDADTQSTYDTLYRLYRALHDATVETQHALGRVAGLEPPPR